MSSTGNWTIFRISRISWSSRKPNRIRNRSSLTSNNPSRSRNSRNKTRSNRSKTSGKHSSTSVKRTSRNVRKPRSRLKNNSWPKWRSSSPKLRNRRRRLRRQRHSVERMVARSALLQELRRKIGSQLFDTHVSDGIRWPTALDALITGYKLQVERARCQFGEGRLRPQQRYGYGSVLAFVTYVLQRDVWLNVIDMLKRFLHRPISNNSCAVVRMLSIRLCGRS